VALQAIDTAGKEHIVDCPSKLPPANRLESISEPYVRLEIITPKDYVGSIMELAQQVGRCYLIALSIRSRCAVPTGAQVLASNPRVSRLLVQRRGEYVDMQYLTETRTTLVYNMPLAEVRLGPAWGGPPGKLRHRMPLAGVGLVQQCMPALTATPA